MRRPFHITRFNVSLGAGFALDLSTGWDLDDTEQCKAARELRRRARPKLLIGCPGYTAWCGLRNLDRNKEDAAARERRLELERKCMDHLRFSIEMYKAQLDDGNDFFREHTHVVGSWPFDELQEARVVS